ncbi:SDR family oxidoreductase [Terracoccus luteus]|jgi:NAD(P)H dehydrogenase (quinone)|uniref:Uncharacterized protein YbjT (DUF2867 family) n=1 Tax=Terracoccus luteus TaxID=53356 RepID=A0A839PSU8_9MICO|nr:SDR family oxidoreductase [Terracoccus luteus]MBB2987348.1 uncharacterized protein YbjT (DUF2867 family) [Terracoccus luteus]MCP2172999.1 uncharacterized protein YbjT (DUF2867 family) [Terracoccus luteus]
MIVVTGSTGALGGAVVDRLLEHLPPEQVVATARDPRRAAHLSGRGVVVRHADYGDPASLRTAFAGAEQVLLVSSNDPTGDPVEQHRAAIDAARQAGVGRVLYTSHQGAAPDSPFVPARTHHATEQLLETSGLAWTSLRNGLYAHTLPAVVGPWTTTGVMTVPADGPVSWTSRDDLAVGAAEVLLSTRPYDGVVTLTAGAAPTFTDAAEQAAAVVGHPVRLEVVDEETWVAALVAAGQPEMRARFTLGIFRAAAGGFFAGTDPLLGRLLGHEPATAADALTAATAAAAGPRAGATAAAGR